MVTKVRVDRCDLNKSKIREKDYNNIIIDALICCIYIVLLQLLHTIYFKERKGEMEF
jgi:hypothetical protein